MGQVSPTGRLSNRSQPLIAQAVKGHRQWCQALWPSPLQLGVNACVESPVKASDRKKKTGEAKNRD